MRLLAGRTIVIEVARGRKDDPDGPPADAPTERLLVPAAYHLDLGMRMKMGEIAAVRKDSKAEEARVTREMVIEEVTLKYAGKVVHALAKGDIDPVRLPSDLARRIYSDKERSDMKEWRVVLRVRGGDDQRDQTKLRDLELEWDASWRFDAEPPYNPTSPLAIPELGLAYRVESLVVKVEKGSLADQAGIQPGHEVREIRRRLPGKTPGEVKWSDWQKLQSRRKGADVYDQWAHVFYALQHADYTEIKLKVFKDGTEEEKELKFDEKFKVEDPTWPLADRGVRLMSDQRLQRAGSLLEAVSFGVDSTTAFIKRIYLNLSSLLSGRISTRSLGGPIEIASQAFSAAEDPFTLILFLGIISVNLAVVNFLPIPVLDGGHMVFLIYEKLRGRPPSETVRAVATYIGLAVILCLMVFVFYQDIDRRLPAGWYQFWKK
jgi:regulator of sigma E protease